MNNLNNNTNNSSADCGPDSSPSLPLLHLIVKLEMGATASDIDSIVLENSREGNDISATTSTSNESPIDLVSPPLSPTPISPPCHWPGQLLDTTPVFRATVVVDLISPTATLTSNLHPHDDNNNSTLVALVVVVVVVAAASSKPPSTANQTKKKQNYNKTPGGKACSSVPQSTICISQTKAARKSESQVTFYI